LLSVPPPAGLALHTALSGHLIGFLVPTAFLVLLTGLLSTTLLLLAGLLLPAALLLLVAARIVLLLIGHWSFSREIPAHRDKPRCAHLFLERVID